MNAVFALDPRLSADALPIGELPLSSVLLMNDARFPGSCSSRAFRTRGRSRTLPTPTRRR